VDSREERVRQLEETIRVLSAENEALAERAEDTLLLGLIAEKVGAATDADAVLDTGLEQLALLKDVPFGACLGLDGCRATVRRAYLAFTDRPFEGAAVDVTPALAEALSAGTVDIASEDWRAYGLDGLIGAVGFVPSSGLAIAYALQEGVSGFFLFAADRPDAPVTKSAMMLNRVVEALTSHLDRIRLLDALKASNQELDRRVAERTEALNAANQKLRQEVAERERADEALKVSLEKYRVLFESFPLGVTIADARGQILEANRMSEELLGLTLDEQTQRTIVSDAWHIVDADGAPLAAEDYASAIALREQRTVSGQRMGVMRGDGTTVWLDVSAAPIPLEGFGVAITYGDVTARVAAEKALRAAEQRHRTLFDHAAEGIAIHELVRDESGRVVNYRLTDINRQYESIVGLTAGEVVGRLATDVYGTAEPPYLAEFSSAPLTGRPLRFETYFAPMDKHFSISVAPIGPNGFATIFFDVTALRKSQQEHETLSALVENSSEFVGMATLEGAVVYVNEAGRRLSGLARDAELSGLTVFDFAPPDWHARIAEHILPAVRERGIWSGEAAVFNRTTGAVISVDITVFVIPSRETGAPLCLATVMHDISERTRAREQRERLEAQLRQAQKMESIGRLAGGVAHDFNNLLTSILGNVELALDGVNPSDPMHPFLQDVRTAGESAASLTRQLLAFSRKQIIEPRVLNLNSLLANMERMLRRTIGEDIVLDVHPAEGIGSVRADAGQMEQVVVNLAVNARDAMPDGGRLRIDTENAEVGEDLCLQHPGARPGTYVVLSVSDTGVGMDENTMAQVFEPFFTTKSLGTGLGLATVYGAVAQNGGFIATASTLGRGTTFRIYLPAVPEAAQTGETLARETPPRGTGLILLVEDDPLVRELARRALINFGYTVVACASGPEALETAARLEGDIDLLLTDVVMPGMNGRELATKLSAERPGLRVLYTSGHTADIIVNRGLLEEGLEFLPKPYSLPALAEKVRATLRRP
jgi:two-component system, cell cycle sensor histidine kinase and response regulator CckA